MSKWVSDLRGEAARCSQSRFWPTIQLNLGGRPMPVELYHFWSSVCSVRCRMALEEKGVPWTSRYIDLFKFDQMRPEYLAINPRGMVPTLVHDGKPVRESGHQTNTSTQPSPDRR